MTARAAFASIRTACVAAVGCGGDRIQARDACPRPPTVGPLSSIDPRAGSGQAIGKDPVFVHLERYTGSKRGRGSVVHIRRKQGEGSFIKLFTVLSRPVVGELRQTVSALDSGDRAGFDTDLGWDPRPRMSELPRHLDRSLSRETFPLLPGGIWVSGPGCYRLVNQGPGFRHTIEFPVDRVP